MSAALMYIYWVGIPMGIFYLARWLFRRSQNPASRGMVVIGAISVTAMFLWVAVGRNMWLDQQVREMCANDGGVKVFETVELTPDLLDKAGRIWIPYKEKAKSSDKYYYEIEEYYFRRGEPQMTRRQARIARRSDGKVLGEKVSYGRGGGGLPGPWHGSSFTCPDPTLGIKFESAIFITGDKK
ncbi:MAG: hypothetical protein Q8R88_17600 [Desulfoprunum sp.]|nr:hypothetical protein [Desulfoprunum sp.]